MKTLTKLLEGRLSGKKSTKMAALAQQSVNGNLSTFSGVFSVVELNSSEKAFLEELLTEFSESKGNLSSDLSKLSTITAEVKAITNQAAILHGERIKQAQVLLRNYREGAFTSWLKATYGNRQTPYNFLQYYEFYQALPQPLKARVDQMPRQAVYALASRDAPYGAKLNLIENYQGQTKVELLRTIRERFPLPPKDGRRINPAENALKDLARIQEQLSKVMLSRSQKQILQNLLDKLQKLAH